ncbi:undecaprenyl-diphosphatase [Devosia lucknowensis]|uniref:Undecaprenyl-diphosphatase n=1 Tax=Devosia lucknowensis TaxID=1096929 RepID=A0A1Y6ECG0_9HYPH|nr:phosphatase PAP2 family protein [Devosia lucknowensis]SMQ58590.1 undecaprenyl-diphosphatase [Devosia lucknowensis]
MLNRLVRSTPIRRIQKFITAEAGLLASIAIVSGLVLAFLNIADGVADDDLVAFDNAILMMFRDPTNIDNVIGPVWLHEMVRDITALGSFILLGFIVVGVCGYLLMLRLKAEALLILVSVLGGTLISTLLKMTYDRPRPDLTAMSHQFTASFPSGHAMLSAVTFLTLGALLARLAPSRSKRIYIFSTAIFLTLIVGMSRIYMGVHFPSDVLAGWCLGAAWALLCSAVAVVLQRRGKVMPTPVENQA